jgi:thioester reductase-like protein
MLGRYVLRDALRCGLKIAALVRDDRSTCARDRMDAILREDESVSNPSSHRPVIVPGDLKLSGCGLDASAIDWIGNHCQAIVHCAASLSFQDSPEGEPRRTNVEGTQHLLELSRIAGIRNWFHVSTAYVAGQRTGIIYEEELDVGQTFCNAYERSKCESEKQVRSAAHLQVVTVFRPSIIVGDSKTGQTPSFHGFYTPLQLILALARADKSKVEGGKRSYLEQLGLGGTERKNFVPVDWVSAVLTHVVRQPDLHGNTYHLTTTQPISVREIGEAIGAVVKEAVSAKETQSQPAPSRTERDTQFVEGMAVYRDYFRDDPEFDNRNTCRAAPHLPCPTLNRDALIRLARYAIEVNFGWPRKSFSKPKFDVESELESIGLRPDWRVRGSLSLNVTGPGGGQWQVAYESARPVACGPGLAADGTAVAHLNVESLAQIVRGRLTPARALALGLLVFIPNRRDLPGHIEGEFKALLNCWRRADRHPAIDRRTPMLQAKRP